MEFINEKELKNYPTIISYESTEKILEQMKNTVCKIKLTDGSLGTGFFCKIPFPTKEKLLPVLITNNHLINKELLKDKKGIILIYQKETEKYKTLNLENRLYYTDEDYDITIIEIKENRDEINNFLELDDNILLNILDNTSDANDNSHLLYISETIYIIQYPEGKLSVSYGLLEKASNNNQYNFSHLCSTKMGSSGSPVLNITNNKVFGIHKQASVKNNYNKGTFLDIPIKEFIKHNLLNKKLITPSNEGEEKSEIKTMSIKEFSDKFRVFVTNNKINNLYFI